MFKRKIKDMKEGNMLDKDMEKIIKAHICIASNNNEHKLEHFKHLTKVPP